MTPTVYVEVDPGICGFSCHITARSLDNKAARLAIADSDCELTQRLNTKIRDVTVKDLFLPLSRNPMIVAAEQAGCHPACPVPTALIKAAETALGLALPKNVSIRIRLERINEAPS